MKKEYTVIQYASATGNQAMIYSITDSDGHLILIDGGWKGDAEQLSEIIKKNGGKVDIWILTHPHPDHIGAFNEIYATGSVEISTIYTIPMNYKMYKNKMQPWDAFEVYEEFLNLTHNADNMIYLKEDDEINLFGLEMEVFHSFDEGQMKDDIDPCNNGSMIFKLSAKYDSILFLADVGIGQSDYILNKYGDRLKADYVQMGHHGNGGLDETVYRVICPQRAFFDAPEWLMQDESRNAPEKKELMESLGAEVNYYATAPNLVRLK